MDPLSLGCNSSYQKALEEKDRHKVIGSGVITVKKKNVPKLHLLYLFCMSLYVVQFNSIALFRAQQCAYK